MNNMNDNIIDYDFQGWPIRKMTVREILERLGVTDYKIENERILDLYPCLLEDDGMGYGVNTQYITEVSYCNDYVNMFRDFKCDRIEEYEEAGMFPGTVISDGEKEWQINYIRRDGTCRISEYAVNKNNSIHDVNESTEYVSKIVTLEELKEMIKSDKED